MTGLQYIPEKQPLAKGKGQTFYPHEYRVKLIGLALENGNVSEVAREYDVNIKTLHGWIVRARS